MRHSITNLNRFGQIRAALAALIWLALWQILAMALGQEYLLASPVQVLERLLHLLTQGDTWLAALRSGGRIVLGFLAAALFGAEVCEHRLSEADGFALTESILGKLTPEVDIFFLCNPNNPTGRLADPNLLYKIAGICRNNETLLILDECFMDFTSGKSLLPQLRKYPNLLILRAFTKIYAMAGLRLGTLYCADAQLLSRIAAFRPAWSVSSVAQIAGIAALKEIDWIENTRRIVESEKKFMEENLRRLGLTAYQSDANFLLLKSERPLYAPLREHGILVRSCGNFTGLDELYIRIGLKKHDENRMLLRVLSEVLNG